ncbi:MAG: MtnX-like HAD-IB family phosphatase [Ignavibacteriaceae bacterium]|nr:MtnX-like HAD-IB family phosphatase [Ignavibacteriaceae bacterium]
MENRQLKIFIDFDGTITKHDVGNIIFKHFGDNKKGEEIITQLRSGEITARQCWEMLNDTVDVVDKTELDAILDKIEIDDAFHSFIELCKVNELDFIVLSDGFDYYIDRIFKRENISNITYYSNHLEVMSDKKLYLSFPHYDSSCTTSANCKRNHVINNSSDDEFTIYIGDGNSDKYPVQFCDYIFAKKGLLKFCEAENIPFFPYTTFYDVIKRFEELLAKKRLKKRHRAELKRKEIYTLE